MVYEIEPSDSEYENEKKTGDNGAAGDAYNNDTHIRVYDESDLFQNDENVPEILYHLINPPMEEKECEDECAQMPQNVALIHTPHHIVISKKIIPVVPITILVAIIVISNLVIMMIFIDLLARGTFLTYMYFGIWVRISTLNEPTNLNSLSKIHMIFILGSFMRHLAFFGHVLHM
jgi:hypothetical protein